MLVSGYLDDVETPPASTSQALGQFLWLSLDFSRVVKLQTSLLIFRAQWSGASSIAKLLQ